MYRYRVRPGYGSSKLLVEFMTDASDEAFVGALRAIFMANGIKTRGTEEHVFLAAATMDSPAGVFEVDHDEWSMVSVHAEENQEAIHFVDRILAASGQFQKEEVDFGEYTRAKPPAPTKKKRLMKFAAWGLIVLSVLNLLVGLLFLCCLFPTPLSRAHWLGSLLFMAIGGMGGALAFRQLRPIAEEKQPRIPWKQKGPRPSTTPPVQPGAKPAPPERL